MTNRLFARLTSNFTNSNSERPFNFSREQHLTFAAVLDGQMLELEKRHAQTTCVPPVPQQRISTAAPPADDQCEPSCTLDDFGLVQGLEIDVRWM